MELSVDLLLLLSWVCSWHCLKGHTVGGKNKSRPVFTVSETQSQTSCVPNTEGLLLLLEDRWKKKTKSCLEEENIIQSFYIFS